MTVGKTKIGAIPFASLDIPPEVSLESQIIYLLNFREIDDEYGVSSSNLAALMHTKPEKVEEVCGSSDRIVKIGEVRKIRCSTWRLQERVKSEK